MQALNELNATNSKLEFNYTMSQKKSHL